MAQKHLTNPVVAKLPAPVDRAVFIHDSRLTGFCVSVSPTGRKAFWFYGRVNGKPKRIKIGTFPDVTAAQAREVCKGIIGDVTKGKDPAAQRRGGRRTLGELFDRYLETHAKRKKRTWQRDVREFDRFLGGWRNKPLGEISRGMVAERVAEIVESNGCGPAHKVRALLSAMFTLAIKLEWMEYNPVRGTDRPTFEPRDRRLTREEIGRFFAAVEQLQRQTTRDLIMMAVFTGARRSNVCSMRWDEIDFSRCVWTIARANFKAKRPHEVPLIPPAMEILARRKSERQNGTPWVFASTGSSTGHVVEVKAAMDRVRELSGIGDLRFHDLRRTLGAWLNDAGVSTRLIQTALGHADIGTTAKIYTPGGGEAVRAATSAAVQAMLDAAKQSAGET